MIKLNKAHELIARDSKVYSQIGRIPYAPLVVKKAYGVTIVDADGNKYIDLISAASSLNTGSNHPRVIQAIKEQLDDCINYTAGYSYNEPMIKLAESLVSIVPAGYSEMKVHFGLSGSDSIDAAIKFARGFTGRRRIVSHVGAFHGATFGALSLTPLALNMRRKVGPLLADIEHIQYPTCYRCPFNLEERSCGLECLNPFRQALSSHLPPEEIAAVIVEPIAGDSGLYVPPVKYMRALYDICKEHGILFCVDEIQQALGRTGKWFCFEHFGIEPDIIVLGKALGSGMPISAVIARQEIIDSLDAPCHGFTMAGHMLSCASALETLKIIREDELLVKADELGAYAMTRFKDMREKFPIIGDVRGLGLSIGVDLVSDKTNRTGSREAAMKICYRCFEKGVFVVFLGNGVLRIQPPLVISKKELSTALDVIEETIQEYVDGQIPDDVLELVSGW